MPHPHTPLGRRDFLLRAGAGLASALAFGAARAQEAARRPPNFIIIFCDDLGYGDLGCYGHPKHKTPNLDRMAAEGTKFTSFYVTSGVCSPSRSSLMTGCYPRRVGVPGVLFPAAKSGLHPDEITIAEVLKTKDYATMCIGKWHLGDSPELLPTRQGFDHYFGLPYSNDMNAGRKDHPPLPLLRDETVIEAPADQNTLTKRYTEEALAFIRQNRDRPFFLYLPHTMVHLPLAASDDFRGTSANGLYGDALQEIDWSTGQILDALRELKIDGQTLVVFSSDNGATNRPGGGSNLPLSGWKGSSMEGGMREPCLMWRPGFVPAGAVCDEMAITMDLMPTFASLAGAAVPSDRIIDGRDILPLVTGQPGAVTPHEVFYYYRGLNLEAVRSGPWKLRLPGAGAKKPAALFNLKDDIAEANDVSAANPDEVARLTALAEKARADIGDGATHGAGQREAATVVSPRPLLMAGSTFVPPSATAAPAGEWKFKAGDSADKVKAPQVMQRAFSVTVTFDAGGDGALVAHGGISAGYALYVQEGRPAFCIRARRGNPAIVRGEAPLPAGRVELTGRVEAKGKMTLMVNGQPVASGKGGLLPSQPAEPLNVGRDDLKAVGPYSEPFAFGGAIHGVVVKTE